MEIVNTRKRFKKRVEFERQILSAVNSLPDHIKPLHGLSEAAIACWKDNNDFLLKDEIAKKVTLLSKYLMVYCDTSKNTFDLDKRIDSSQMDRKIDEFKIFLEEELKRTMV
jgi:hypothetical protein